MSQLRFSLASLLTFTLFVAFICAALRYATELWASAAVSLTAVLLLLSVLAAILRPAVRPFWIGFALLGLAYYYASVGPGGAALYPRLVTTPFLEYIEGMMESPAPSAPKDEVVLALDALVQQKFWVYQGQTVYPVPAPGSFQAIGHSALAVLIGLVGGIASHVVRSPRLSATP